MGSCADGLWGWGLVGTAGSQGCLAATAGLRSPGDREGCVGIWSLPSESVAGNAVWAEARG